MPERVFSENDSLADSAGRAAVAAYFERLRMGEPFSVQCEALESLPYPVDEVWQIVLETQHLGTWLEDGVCRCADSRALPSRLLHQRGVWRHISWTASRRGI